MEFSAAVPPQPETFFPVRYRWRHRRAVTAGVMLMHAHESGTGDVALTPYESCPADNPWGTVVMLLRHGADDFWLMARHVSAGAHVTWQMRRNHDGLMQFRSTGYHDEMGPAVFHAVAGAGDFYDVALGTLGRSFSRFAHGARAALASEIRRRELPSRLLPILVAAGISEGSEGNEVDTRRDHELPAP